MKFEILLDNDPHLRDRARKRIEQVTGNLTENFAPNHEYPDFGNFIEVNLAVTGEDVWKAHETLVGLEGVVDVDPDFKLDAKEAELNARYFAESVLNSSAEEVHPSADWYHQFIRFPEAVQWARSEFTRGTGQFNDQRIRIAQLDTGYTNHPEVRNFKTRDGYNFLESEDPDYPYDRLQSTRPFPILWGGHGSSCAGVMIGSYADITTREPNPSSDLYFDDQCDGLFPNVDLLPCRISRNIISFSNKMARALQWVIDKGDIPIVSISHASLWAKQSDRLAVQAAAERGIIIVAAAGSHISGFKRIFTYPAKYPETIAVAASTWEGLPWNKTHGGAEVSLSAPGYEIYIPFPYKKKGVEYYAYKWSEGSSFSVPITACAAALWLSHHGIDALKARYPGAQLVELFRTMAKHTVTPFPAGVDTSLYGPGVLNVKQLLTAPLPAAPPVIGGTQTLIANLKTTVETTQDRYTNEKELAFLTLLGKLETDDHGSDLADFVLDSASSSLKAHLGAGTDSESIKTRVKTFVNTYYGG